MCGLPLSVWLDVTGLAAEPGSESSPSPHPSAATYSPPPLTRFGPSRTTRDPTCRISGRVRAEGENGVQSPLPHPLATDREPRHLWDLPAAPVVWVSINGRSIAH